MSRSREAMCLSRPRAAFSTSHCLALQAFLRSARSLREPWRRGDWSVSAHPAPSTRKARRRVDRCGLRPAAGSGTMTAIALCTDDRCLLQDDGVGSVFIADLVLRVMSGEDVSELISSKPPFTRKDQCLECVLRVMRDRRPLRTVAEYEKLVDAGRWSHRRWRRRARREQRESASRPVTTSFL